MEYLVYGEWGFTGHKALYIKNPDKTDAYHVELRRGSDTLVRRGGIQGPVISRILFDPLHRYAQIEFENNAQTTLAAYGVISITHDVIVPAMPERSPFRCKAPPFTSNCWRLEDAKKTEFAYFQRSWSLGAKLGTIIIKQPGLSQQLVDQLVIILLAMEEKLRGQGNRR